MPWISVWEKGEGAEKKTREYGAGAIRMRLDIQLDSLQGQKTLITKIDIFCRR